MPQVIHVVQCYDCRMYQVDIVKKASKWTCKLCGEKQSLKQVFFQGSGKECRLQTQRLNELQGVTEQNHFSEDVSPLSGHQLSPLEEIKTETNWPDDHDDEIFNGLPIEYTEQEACYNKQENNKPKIYQQEMNEIRERNDVSSVCKNTVQTKRTNEESTDCFSQSQSEPATKLRKIEASDSTHHSEWGQYLPDELSD